MSDPARGDSTNDDPDTDGEINVHHRTKDGKPMKFAVLPKEPTDEDLQRFVDFLNGEGEFAGDAAEQ